MDPLTHALVGGMVAKSIGTDRRRFWLMMFMGVAPDLDFLLSGLGGWAAIFHHRGLTHSFVGVVIQAVLYAAAFGRWDRGPFRIRAWQYSLPLALHVFCDYLTSFGVPLLSPFSFHDFSADLVTGLNIIPAAFMLTGLAWMHYQDQLGWRAVRPLWIIWGIYLSLSMSGKAYADRCITCPRPATVLPTMYNPFAWRAVYTDPVTHTYHEDVVDLLNGQTKAGAALPMTDGDFPVQASLKSNQVQSFLHDVRWPLARVQPHQSGWTVQWGNLLFSHKGLVRGKVEVEISSDGKIISEKRIFNFWNPDPIS